MSDFAVKERKIWLDSLVSKIDRVNALMAEHGAGTTIDVILIYRLHDELIESTGCMKYGFYELAEEVGEPVNKVACVHEPDDDLSDITHEVSFQYRGYKIVSYVLRGRD